MKKINSNNLTWGIFPYRFPYLHKNIRGIFVLIKRVFFVLKHGYAPQAQWETYLWFLDTFGELLKFYRYNRSGDMYIIGDFPDRPQTDDENVKVNNELFDRMIELLEKMKQYPTFIDKTDEDIEDAKNEFFNLFSKYFYDFWD